MVDLEVVYVLVHFFALSLPELGSIEIFFGILLPIMQVLLGVGNSSCLMSRLDSVVALFIYFGRQ